MTAGSWINFIALGALFPSIFKFLQANDTRNFVLILSSRLTSNESGIILERKQVENQMNCGQWCLRTTNCRSFNLEKDTGQLERECELLSIDRNQRKELVKESNYYDHYTTTDPCDQLSCLNGGTCRMTLSGYWCACQPSYLGEHCEIPEECVKHKSLSEADRNINNGIGSRKCDNKLSGWHRFVGPAGSHMLDNCPSGKKCNTDFQGWIDSQPKPGETRVAKKVCLQGNNKCCNWPKDILTTHCGDFIVYKLHKTNCYIRFCGEN